MTQVINYFHQTKCSRTLGLGEPVMTHSNVTVSPGLAVWSWNSLVNSGGCGAMCWRRGACRRSMVSSGVGVTVRRARQVA